MNKPVLITGATSGIGQAATRLLSSRGYDVFATYRDPSDRATLAAMNGVHPIQMDVSQPDHIVNGASLIADQVGDNGLYAVINNAGVTYTAPFEFTELDRARNVIDVNLMAPYLVTQACLPMLRQHNALHDAKARVINVASWAGMMASPFIGFYNATKYGLIGLTETMYYDLGLLDIHAVLAVPGVTKSPLLAKTTDDALTSLNMMSDEGRDRYRPYLEHFSTLSQSSSDTRMLLTPAQAAEKIGAIVEKRRPRFQYSLSTDAKLISGVVTRLLPFKARAAMNRRMYRLGTPMSWPDSAKITSSLAAELSSSTTAG